MNVSYKLSILMLTQAQVLCYILDIGVVRFIGTYMENVDIYSNTGVIVALIRFVLTMRDLIFQNIPALIML